MTRQYIVIDASGAVYRHVRMLSGSRLFACNGSHPHGDWRGKRAAAATLFGCLDAARRAIADECSATEWLWDAQRAEQWYATVLIVPVTGERAP